MKKRAILWPIVLALVSTLQAATSGELSPQGVLTSMKLVADWQLAQPAKSQNDDWTYGVFYAGVMSLSQVADSPKYHDAMLSMGKKHEWKPGTRAYDADDYCVTQTYLELYLQHREPAMLDSTRQCFDSILNEPKTNSLAWEKAARDRWAWCDALFMGPPAWVRMYDATSDKKYLEFMDREFWKTSAFLYDKQEHMYFRDSSDFEKREANGKKVYWSRGNGWVLAGLARILQVMPPEFSHRKMYEQQFREMAEKIASLQQPDGLWHSSLLDPAAYPLKESSGSALCTFAIAWGINRGVLDRAKYESVVMKSWDALNACVTSEGKLEHVQPVGSDTKQFDPTHTEVFGAGAYLLAGSEMYRLGLSHASAAAYAAFLPQRKDDVAWENERIAFRVYGPALEATGEIGSGLDVWCKRTRKPIVENWYYHAQYHKDHGEGLDMYKVGTSRGCGGTGIYRDGKVFVANNFVTCDFLENGPERASFELTYAPYDAGGTKIRETKRITLQTGSNLNLIENRFDWEGGPDELEAIVGIVKRDGGGAPVYAPDDSWMAYWEPEQPGDGIIGCGVVLSARAKAMDTKDQAFLRTTVRRGKVLEYYAGAGWTKSGDFPDKESWYRYIAESGSRIKTAAK